MLPTNKILDGRAVATTLLSQLKETIQQQSLSPKLVIFQIGEDAASAQYVAMKERRAFETGISTEIIHLPEGFSNEELSQLIGEKALESDGTMLQLPLPPQYDTRLLLDAIMPDKDVDGICTRNLQALERGERPQYAPAVAEAVATVLEHYEIALANKSIVVIGKGKYVGKPIGEFIKLKYPTARLSWIDIDTQDKEISLKSADIVISCVGQAYSYADTQLKPATVLIDVGTSLDKSSGKIVGDFKVSEINTLAAYTPVPGGIGPVTIACLLKNVVEACQNQKMTKN